MGINSPLAPNPSIALGTSEVTLVEMTGAYAPFANGGFAVMPHVIQKIRTAEGKVLFERSGLGPWPGRQPGDGGDDESHAPGDRRRGDGQQGGAGRLGGRRQDRHSQDFATPGSSATRRT
jgi:hypothetical protein